jgi:two-component system OmpR family response regulator
MATNILLVEDDVFSCTLIAAYLGERGMNVMSAGTGEAAIKVLETQSIDLVILDLELPDMDGLAVLRRLRARSPVPAIIISIRDKVEDRIGALENGADDYLTKPFEPRELAARIKVQLRREQWPIQIETSDRRDLFFGNWSLRYARRDLRSPNGNSVSLTAAEFNLLYAMLNAPLNVLTRDQLLDAIARGGNAPIDRTVDVLVSRLRRKIETDTRNPTFIRTIPGFGYMFAVAVTDTRNATAFI